MDVHTFKEINFRKSLYNNYLHFIFSVPKIGYKFLNIGYAFPPLATVQHYENGIGAMPKIGMFIEGTLIVCCSNCNIME